MQSSNCKEKFFFSAMWFWYPLIIVWYIIIYIRVCLTVSGLSYAKIFFTLCHHQNQVKDHVQQPNQTNQLNMAQYKKTMFTAIWRQSTMVACYLPYVIYAGISLHAKSGLSATLYLAGNYTDILVYLNSSLNPILY